jgi:hypothetical protein
VATAFQTVTTSEVYELRGDGNRWIRGSRSPR